MSDMTYCQHIYSNSTFSIIDKLNEID